MKQAVLSGFLLLLLLAPAAVQAQEHRHHDFDTWFGQHRDIAVEVQVRPELLRDRGYLDRHRELREYLREHDAYVTEYIANPYPFVEERHEHERHWHRYPDNHWGY